MHTQNLIKWTFGTLAALLLAAPAQAHFLWAELQSTPTPTLNVRFSEVAGEKTLPQLLPRIRPAHAWTTAGRKLTLTPGSDRLTATCGSPVAAVEQTWGVLDKSAEKRGVFLLHYYAKAASGLDGARQSAGLPVEITLTQIGSPCRALVTLGGRPAAAAEVLVARPGEAAPQSLITGKDGGFQFNLQGVGLYAVRAMVAEAKRGNYEGKTYQFVRHYTTLTFPVGSQNSAKRAEASPAKADPAAYALLKAAHDTRQVLPNNFAELTADVVFNDNGIPYNGTVAYSKQDKVALRLTGLPAEAQEWLEGQLSNTLGHRCGGDFAQGDGRNPITFTPDDDSPLGRQVALNDGLQSLYRVKDNTVTEVTRTMGGARFTITVLETTAADEGKYLPRHFVVTYFDAKTKALRSVEEFSDTYARADGVWVPMSRRVVTAENGKLTTRLFTLTNVKVKSGE